ncbi:MAG TPA: hypothetical protein VMW10_07200 [Alphaproteobacteria bacterium]|nr:hypothetical protein [Alphaproteobacteria bacterium]
MANGSLLKRTFEELRTLDSKTWSMVRYTLTWKEWFERWRAHRQARDKGGCPADYMSENLENLLCGFIPSRHQITVHFVRYVEPD